MIWFDGVSSDDVGVRVEHSPNFYLPARKGDVISIPGRSGDIAIEQNAWENYTRYYDIYISAEFATGKLPAVMRNVSNWLNKSGYLRLEDSYDPGVFYRARFAGGISVTNHLGRYGRAKIGFDCDPRKYLTSGETPVTATGTVELNNPSIVPAYPKITFTLAQGDHIFLTQLPESEYGGTYHDIMDWVAPSAGTYTFDYETLTISYPLSEQHPTYYSPYVPSLDDFFPLYTGKTSIHLYKMVGSQTQDLSFSVVPRWAVL